MSAHIDHKQRKQLIIARSIILFSEQGYNGVTYQKIADACGFARTVLYQYFKNKCEIFSYAIEQLNNQLRTSMSESWMTVGFVLPNALSRF